MDSRMCPRGSAILSPLSYTSVLLYVFWLRQEPSPTTVFAIGDHEYLTPHHALSPALREKQKVSGGNEHLCSLHNFYKTVCFSSGRNPASLIFLCLLLSLISKFSLS